MRQQTDVLQIVRRTESSAEFQEWATRNADNYLVHIFATAGSTLSQFELGFYSKKDDKITVFKTSPITVMEPEEVFKEQGALQKLSITCVKIGAADVLAAAHKFSLASYPNDNPTKTICILQQTDGPVWNITIISSALRMINMKIDATTGELLSREMLPIMSLVKE